MTNFAWPSDDSECAKLAREVLIQECVSHVGIWSAHGSDLVLHQEPEREFLRPWSAIAKEDRAYREVFSTLTGDQKAKVCELLKKCVSGVIFSTLCTLDQFPHGEVELYVWDGVCGEGKRRFRIAPTSMDLHDDFKFAMDDQTD